MGRSMNKQLLWASDQNIARIFPKETVGSLAQQCYCVAKTAKNWESPWSVEMFEQTILLPATRYCFLFEDRVMLGFIIGRAVGDECDIYFVAVTQPQQGKGYAKELLRHFIVDQFDRGIRHFYLEVRISNISAQSVYRYWNFDIDSQVHNFYRDPKEDAYKMSLHFADEK